MKTGKLFSLKNIVTLFLVVGFLIYIPWWTDYMMESENPLTFIPLGIILIFFVLNMAVRRKLNYKGYFTSPSNILTSKSMVERTYDIPVDLMYEKLKEVIDDSSFNLTDFNAQRHEILATSNISFWSWGENLYLSMVPDVEQTKVTFISATFFQVYAWGKNDRNLDKVVEEIEDSLTI